MYYIHSTPLLNPNQPNMQVINNNNKYCANCAALLMDSNSVYCDAHKYMHQSPAAPQQARTDLHNPELVVADTLCHATKFGLNDHFINDLRAYLEKNAVDPSAFTLVVGIAVGSCETHTVFKFVDGKIRRRAHLTLGGEERNV